MNRPGIRLLCVSAFLLSGCLCPALPLPQMAAQVLEPVHIENFESKFMMPNRLRFSEKGNTFLVAGKNDFIYIYDAANFEKNTEIKKNSDEAHLLFVINDAGYIDNNTWYYTKDDFNRDDSLRNAAVHIRQIEPARELHRHDWGRFSSSPVLANATHIAHGRRLLNWHDGSAYEVVVEHPGRFSYGLTPDSLVVTSNYEGNVYLFYDPVKQNGTVWNVGAARSAIQNAHAPTGMRSGSLILSPDAQYGLVTSNRGKCELWRLQLPQKELAGRCGRSGLFGGKRWHRVAFTRDSSAFAIAAENELFVYAMQPFRQIMATKLVHKVKALALEADRLAVADESGVIFVWNTATSKLLGEYRPTMDTEDDADNQTTHLLDLQPGGRKLLASQRYRFMVFDLPVAP